MMDVQLTLRMMIQLNKFILRTCQNVLVPIDLLLHLLLCLLLFLCLLLDQVPSTVTINIIQSVILWKRELNHLHPISTIIAVLLQHQRRLHLRVCVFLGTFILPLHHGITIRSSNSTSFSHIPPILHSNPSNHSSMLIHHQHNNSFFINNRSLLHSIIISSISTISWHQIRCTLLVTLILLMFLLVATMMRALVVEELYSSITRFHLPLLL